MGGLPLSHVRNACHDRIRTYVRMATGGRCAAHDGEGVGALPARIGRHAPLSRRGGKATDCDEGDAGVEGWAAPA